MSRMKLNGRYTIQASRRLSAYEGPPEEVREGLGEGWPPECISESVKRCASIDFFYDNMDTGFMVVSKI